MFFGLRSFSSSFRQAAKSASSALSDFWHDCHQKSLDEQLAQITRQRSLTPKERQKVFALIRKGADVRGPLNEAIVRDAGPVVSALLDKPQHYFLIRKTSLTMAKNGRYLCLYTIQNAAQKLSPPCAKTSRKPGIRRPLQIVSR